MRIDFGMLSLDEWDQLIADNTSLDRQMLRDRKALFEKLQGLECHTGHWLTATISKSSTRAANISER